MSSTSNRPVSEYHVTPLNIATVLGAERATDYPDYA